MFCRGLSETRSSIFPSRALHLSNLRRLLQVFPPFTMRVSSLSVDVAPKWIEVDRGEVLCKDGDGDEDGDGKNNIYLGTF